jgi:CRISPR-associated protein Cas5d
MNVDKLYPIAMEVSGHTAMFATPQSGSEQSTYPAPTPTAIKGMFESILFLRHAEVVPVMVHICNPIRYAEDGFNYHAGPDRKRDLINKGCSLRYQVSFLSDVRYQLFAVVRDATLETASHVSQSSSPYYGKVNHAHSYQEQFNRKLKRGQCRYIPCLGKSMCMVSSFEPLTDTQPCKSINLNVGTMLKRIFPRPFSAPPMQDGEIDFAACEKLFNLKIENGVLVFEPKLIGHVASLLKGH